jgi:hypothetical protein
MRTRSIALVAASVALMCFGALSAMSGAYLASRHAALVVEDELAMRTMLENNAIDRAGVNAYAAKVGRPLHLSEKPGDPLGYIELHRLFHQDSTYARIHMLSAVLLIAGFMQILAGSLSLGTSAVKQLRTPGSVA